MNPANRRGSRVICQTFFRNTHCTIPQPLTARARAVARRSVAALLAGFFAVPWRCRNPRDGIRSIRLAHRRSRSTRLAGDRVAGLLSRHLRASFRQRATGFCLVRATSRCSRFCSNATTSERVYDRKSRVADFVKRSDRVPPPPAGRSATRRGRSARNEQTGISHSRK